MAPPESPKRARPRSESVFVSGASGFLGLEVVRQLSSAGLHVVGLVRDPKKSPLVEAAGARVVVGDVLDLELLRESAGGCRLFLHLASAQNDESPPAGYVEQVRVEG